jgi:hypothetical protein
MRQRNSERKIDRVVREDAEQDDPKREGILELFLSPRSAAHFVGPPEKKRDEDEPLTRDADDDEEHA